MCTTHFSRGSRTLSTGLTRSRYPSLRHLRQSNFYFSSCFYILCLHQKSHIILLLTSALLAIRCCSGYEGEATKGSKDAVATEPTEASDEEDDGDDNEKQDIDLEPTPFSSELCGMSFDFLLSLSSECILQQPCSIQMQCLFGVDV